MTPRVTRLLDRAARRRGGFWTRRRWVSESYAQTEGQPVPIRKALALERVLRKMYVRIGADELIVGRHPESRAPANVPPRPTLKPDQNRLRSDEERAALQAGVFTSGAKTGHLTPDYPLLLAEGWGGILARVEATGEHGDELQAMAITLRAASAFAQRYARHASRLAASESDTARAHELNDISGRCEHIAHDPPRTLLEALQLLWFTFLIQCIEVGEGTAAFALGRFDQYLFPFWRADMDAGQPREALIEQVALFWAKLNEFSGLQVLNLTIGGTDREGRDAVNDLSYACLEIMGDVRSEIPSLSVRWHPNIDPQFFREAAKLSAAGFGQPAFYGDPTVIKAMTNAGVEPRDATDVVPGGCVELGVQGCCNPWVGNFFNLPKCLELALHDGIDPQSGERVGAATGEADDIESFDKLLAAYDTQVRFAMELMAHAENTADRLEGDYSPYPFLSSLVSDCIERGKDITAGGARYNFTEVQGIGIAHVVDSLLNVRRLVFERREMLLEDLVAKLAGNFEGDEPLRQRLSNMRPAYGDHSAETSELARRVVHGFFGEVERYTNPRGGTFRPGLLVWTLYSHWADHVGALPDGHRRGDALVSSIGPRLDLAIDTPTSIVLDATAFDHFRCAGSLALNLRFDATLTESDEGLDAIRHLMEVYFDEGGMQLQINVVDSDLLRNAQANPSQFRGLIVRVSGFSARFVTLDRRMQNEIIARAELAP